MSSNFVYFPLYCTICGEFLETEEGLNYLCSENKGADQLRGDTCFHIYAKSMFSHNAANMSNIIRKPAFCKCGNKDADQLCGNRAADQRLCFRYIDLLIEKVEGLYYDDHSTIPLLSQSEI